MTFNSLENSLNGWFDKPLEDLPTEQHHRVVTDFLPAIWESLSPDQRRYRAKEWDCQSNPALEHERQYWWDFYIRMDELKLQIETWSVIATPTAADLAQKESRLAKLQLDLSDMEKKEIQPFGSHVGSGDFGSDQNNSSIGTNQSIPAKGCAAFLVMRNLTANEVSITFVGDKTEYGLGVNNLVEIAARGTTKPVALAALDLIGLHNRRLNKQCATLLSMSQMRKLPSSPGNRKSISRLRELFRNHLGVNDDPFEPYRKGAGWVPRFKIFDKRGAADERAKREGIRKTDSLETFTERGMQFSVTENDAAADWLKNADFDAPL